MRALNYLSPILLATGLACGHEPDFQIITGTLRSGPSYSNTGRSEIRAWSNGILTAADLIDEAGRFTLALPPNQRHELDGTLIITDSNVPPGVPTSEISTHLTFEPFNTVNICKTQEAHDLGDIRWGISNNCDEELRPCEEAIDQLMSCELELESICSEFPDTDEACRFEVCSEQLSEYRQCLETSPIEEPCRETEAALEDCVNACTTTRNPEFPRCLDGCGHEQRQVDMHCTDQEPCIPFRFQAFALPDINWPSQIGCPEEEID